MIPFLNVLQYLLLSLWVGAMFAFGALYAPVLFRILPSRDQAGAIAGETLARIDVLGLVTGGIMAVVTVLQTIDGGWKAIDLGRLLTAVLMLALVVFSSVTIRQRLNAVRQQMGRPIDEVPEDDPRRLEHGKLHRLSRLIFSINMILGALLIILSALRPA
ncbi:MAG TPA: DUF4149 domain-containing protein [Symbiobacteriaceae bacterium]|nr:DUF4149 domain-containing protein [Symbiobacteriaceae bacterium]